MKTAAIPTLKVVSGVIQNNEGLYFVALRPPHVPFSGVWEFPGGKIEAGESPFEALVRELKEEIGITVIAANLLMQFQHAYPTRIIDMSAWQITHYEGQPYGAEGQGCDWVSPEKLTTLVFPEANYVLINHLLSAANTAFKSSASGASN